MLHDQTRKGEILNVTSKRKGENVFLTLKLRTILQDENDCAQLPGNKKMDDFLGCSKVVLDQGLGQHNLVISDSTGEYKCFAVMCDSPWVKIEKHKEKPIKKRKGRGRRKKGWVEPEPEQQELPEMPPNVPILWLNWTVQTAVIGNPEKAAAMLLRGTGAAVDIHFEETERAQAKIEEKEAAEPPLTKEEKVEREDRIQAFVDAKNAEPKSETPETAPAAQTA